MKKILIVVFLMMIFSADCYAMTFSSPMKVGVVSDYRVVDGGYEFKNAVNNSGIIYDWQNRKCYKKMSS